MPSFGCKLSLVAVLAVLSVLQPSTSAVLASATTSNNNNNNKIKNNNQPTMDREAERDRAQRILAQRDQRRRQRGTTHHPNTDDASQEQSHRTNKKKEPVLMLPGRVWPLNFLGGEFSVGGNIMLVHEEANSGRGTGWNVWDCSIALAKFIEHEFGRDHKLRGQKVVEVGAGPGVAGLAAALLGAHTAITDLGEVVPLMSRNAAANKPAVESTGGSIIATELDWFRAQDQVPLVLAELARRVGPTASSRVEISSDGVEKSSASCADIVLAADVIWVEELIEPLIHTIELLVPVGCHTTRILLAYQSRSRRADDLLFSLLDKGGFDLSSVARDRMHPQFHAAHIGIFEVVRR